MQQIHRKIYSTKSQNGVVEGLEGLAESGEKKAVRFRQGSGEG